MSERNYLLAAVTPIVLVGLLFAYGFAKEARAKQRTQARLTELTADQPDYPQQIEYDRLGHRSNSDIDARLSELSASADQLSQQLRVFADENNDRADRLVAPGSDWDVGPIVKDIADRAGPIISEAKRLIDRAEHSLPDGRFSLRFEWMSSFEVPLTARMRTAVHDGDRSGALDALATLKEFAMNTNSYGYAGSGFQRHRDLINQSLAIGFWTTAEEIAALQNQVSNPADLNQRWVPMIRHQQVRLQWELEQYEAGNRQWQLGMYGSTFVLPGETMWYLLQHTIDQAQVTAPVGSIAHVRQIEALSEDHRSLSMMTIVGYPYADCRHYDVAIGLRWGEWGLAQNEFERRMTLTSIGVKRFQIETGHWPRSLDELASVGLSPQDWRYQPSTEFHYQRSQDGSEAQVWVDHQFRALVKPELIPTNAPKYLPKIDQVVIVIR